MRSEYFRRGELCSPVFLRHIFSGERCWDTENGRCDPLSYGAVPEKSDLDIIGEADTEIIHYSIFIIHYSFRV